MQNELPVTAITRIATVIGSTAEVKAGSSTLSPSESWLHREASGMAPLFEALDAPLPSRVRVAIGFTSRGAKEGGRRVLG